MLKKMFIFWIVVGCVSAVEVHNGNRRVGATNPAPITCVNPATSGALLGKQIVVSTAAENAVSVAVGDFNGDGHLDLASASYNDQKIAWYKNFGGLGAFGAQIVVSTNAGGAYSVVVGDFNGDGYLDLASASEADNKIAWYKNTDGLGTFGAQIVVSTNALWATSMAVGDFNGDGHLDLASASRYDNKIAWYKNTDGLGTFGTQIVVSTAAKGARSVVVGDFNGDGYLDLASASEGDNKIAWYKNTDGLGTFGAQIVVSTNASGAWSVAVGDFNGNGHLDLASASSNDKKIAWYKNTDGLGTFGTQTVVSTNASGAWSVAVGDFNGDGHLDLASASSADNKIAWYKNTDGLGTFGAQIVVSTNASWARSVTVGDFNGDGHLDLASASDRDDKIAWYKNLGNCCPPGSSTPDGTICSFCPSGSYSDGINSNTCHPCQAGRYTDQNAQPTCKGRCPAGTFSSEVGQTTKATCTGRCPAGTFSNEVGLGSSTECKGRCPAGTFSSEVGQTTKATCTGRCPAGTFSNEVGLVSSSQCEGRCPAGTFSSEVGQTTKATCTGRCPAGTFSNEVGLGSSTECKGRCPAGTFSSEVGQTTQATCKGRCPTGTFSSEVGLDASSQCQRCSAGTFSSEIGQTRSDACQSCAAHYYNSEKGRSACTHCPSGWDTVFSKSIACSNLHNDPGCPQGKFSTQNPAISFYCTNCSAGTFSSIVGQVFSCSGRCPPGRYSLATGLHSSDECSECAPDFYSEIIGASTNVCQHCPSGFTTNTVMGSTECSPMDIPVYVWIVIVCGSVVLVVGVVFYRYRMHQRDAQSETQLTEIHQMNQSLLESANNPLEQSQFNIPSHELDLHERIASGGNGWIYTATMGANTIVAAKEIMSTTIDPDDILEFEHEARMLTQLNHPHVLRVFGFCTKTAEESKDNIERRYIVTEFAPNGSLENVVVAATKVAKVIKDSNSGAIPMPFTKLEALEWAVQIASGIAFLHSKGFVHRDIKPQNVLLNKSNDALVADLGTVRRPPSGLYPNDPVAKSTTTDQEKEQYMEEFCQDIDEEQGRAFTLQATLRGMTDMKGTPMYMAPEQFQDPNYSYPVDVWAYGLTLMRLFTLNWPFPLETPLRQLVMGIAHNELRPEMAGEEYVPHQDVLKLMEECVQFEASKRPTMKEVERRLTNVLKLLLNEEKESVKKERRRIKDIKKERRIKRRETARLAKEKESKVHRERKKG